MDQSWTVADMENLGTTWSNQPHAVCLPVRLQRGAEEVLRLRHWGSGAESQLSLVCVLVLRLTLQRRIDGDGNLLHCRWLEKVKRGVRSVISYRIIAVASGAMRFNPTCESPGWKPCCCAREGGARRGWGVLNRWLVSM